jgi:hypothetical protein
MTSIHLPPSVRAWTQNFQFSMGVIRLSVLQKLVTWFLRSTSGRTTTVLTTTAPSSVRIHKRSNSQSTHNITRVNLDLGGIERVAYLARIEISNLFLTSYTWFILAGMLVTLIIVICRVVSSRIATDRGQLSLVRYNAEAWSNEHKGLLFQVSKITKPLN